MFPQMPQGGAGSPSPQQAPPQQPPAQPGGGFSSLNDTPMASPSAGPTPEQMQDQFMKQIQQLSTALDALASEFPAASKDLQKAKQSLVDSMSSVAAHLVSTNGAPAPRIA